MMAVLQSMGLLTRRLNFKMFISEILQLFSFK